MFKFLIPYWLAMVALALSALIALNLFCYHLGADHERAKQLTQFQIEKAQLINQLQTIERQNTLANQRIVKQRNDLQHSNQTLQKKINHEIKTSPDYKRCLIPDNGLHLINAARYW